MTKTRHRNRRHSLAHYALSIPKKIVRHPANRGQVVRQTSTSVLYQARKRLGIPPASVSLGDGMEVLYSDASGVSNLVYFGRYFEFDEIHFIERLLRPGDVFVDGGANIGVVSLIASRLVGAEGRVHAFEPAPVALAKLRANLAHNDISNTVVHDVALSDEAGEVLFLADWDVSNAITTIEQSTSERTTRVRAARLDDLLPADTPIALAKLDLEGGEMQALRGAESLLAAGTIRVLLLEAFDHQLRRLGSTRDEVLDFLKAAGYETFEYHADSNRLEACDPDAQNFVAVHADALSFVDSRLGASRGAQV